MRKLFNEFVKSITTYIMFKIKAKANGLKYDLDKKGRSPIFLSMGAPTDPPPKQLIETLKKEMSKSSVHTYSTPKGEKYLLEAISKKMHDRYHVDVDVDTEICSLLGSKEGLANFLRILIQPNRDINEQDVIFVPDPGYASYSQMITVAGGKFYPVPLTAECNFMPNMDLVWDEYIKNGGRADRVKALIINYPNNPLGAGMTKDYAKKIVEFCRKHNILLMSDAAYSDMYFDDSEIPFSILEIPNAKDIAVEFYSFSKPYAMTGMRAGWVCGNRDAISLLAVLKSTIDNGLYKPLQTACAEILNSKEGEKYIKEANNNLKKKQDIFINGIKELGWSNFYIPNATFYLWLPIPPRYKSSQEFTDDLLETSGIVAVPGHAYGKHGEGFFRVSLVCSEGELKECLHRMRKDGFYFSK